MSGVVERHFLIVDDGLDYENLKSAYHCNSRGCVFNNH